MQGPKAPPSIAALERRAGLRSSRTRRLGVAALDGSAGFVAIVVCGEVRSTSTLRIALDGWPALSVATTASAWLPSVAGMLHETQYGPGAATVPSGFHTPVAQSLLWFGALEEVHLGDAAAARVGRVRGEGSSGSGASR